MKHLGKQTRTTEANITDRIQEMEEKVSGVEDTIEETDSSDKESIKYNKFLTQSIQEFGKP